MNKNSHRRCRGCALCVLACVGRNTPTVDASNRALPPLCVANSTRKHPPPPTHTHTPINNNNNNNKKQANLKEADFTGADLTGASLEGAALDGAIFTNAVLQNAYATEVGCWRRLALFVVLLLDACTWGHRGAADCVCMCVCVCVCVCDVRGRGDGSVLVSLMSSRLSCALKCMRGEYLRHLSPPHQNPNPTQQPDRRLPRWQTSPARTSRTCSSTASFRPRCARRPAARTPRQAPTRGNR